MGYFYGAPIPHIDHFGSYPSQISQISLLLWSSYSAHRPFRQLSFANFANLATFMELLFRTSTISAAILRKFRKSRYFYGAPIPQIDHFGSYPSQISQISLLLWSSYSANRPFRQLSCANFANLASFMELL